MNKTTTNITEYFAASNGFDGFKSNFKEVFNPKSFEIIYILKGGPGTGKSSLMKYIAESTKEKCESIDLIYCSSDTDSLDGVIIKNKDTRVAIIDGTAPHMTDPKYPGAIEKIINLGECWNSSMLKKARENIINITESKDKAYKLAYDYLKICKSISEQAENLCESLFVGDTTPDIKKLTDTAKSTKFESTERIIEAFGGSGFVRLKTGSRKKVYHVVGIYGSEHIFYKHLLNYLNANKISYVRYPHVLCQKESVGALITDTNTEFITPMGIVNSSATDDIIDTSKYLDQRGLAKEKGRLEFLWRERETMLWNSVNEFKSAKDNHMMLEKIYVSAMNFDRIDRIKEKLLTEIKKLLKIK